MDVIFLQKKSMFFRFNFKKEIYKVNSKSSEGCIQCIWQYSIAEMNIYGFAAIVIAGHLKWMLDE